MKRLLIVDDDDAILEALVDLLSDEYEVRTAHDGKQALVAVEAERFDAILLDVMMPELDGISFKRELDVRGVEVAIVVMSAGSHIAMQAAQMGVKDFVRKPFDLKDLERALAGAFSRGGGSGGAGNVNPPAGPAKDGDSEDGGGTSASTTMRSPRRAPRSTVRSLRPRARRSIAASSR